jgi:hypothetical protein
MFIISHCNDWYGNRPFSSGMQCYLATHFLKKIIADFLILIYWNTGFQFFSPNFWHMLPDCQVFMTHFQISLTTCKMRTAVLEINFMVENWKSMASFPLWHLSTTILLSRRDMLHTHVLGYHNFPVSILFFLFLWICIICGKYFV